MNFIIFKIKYYNYYNGIEDNSLNIYDKFYQEKKSNNPEMYNFQDYNGFCYGYAPLKSGVVNLTSLKYKNDKSILFKDALVLWVCEKDNKNYLIGWYKNAIVYNFLQRKLSYPSVGRDLYFNVSSKSKDCFLLPLDKRNFTLDINFEQDTNFYIGNDTDILYNKINNFINSYGDNFINTKINDIIDKTLEDTPKNPILLYKRGTIYLHNENNFLEALKYFNSALLFKDMLNKNQITDVYYQKALCLQFLHSFDNSLTYFKKVIKNINYDLTILKNMIYLSIYTEKFLDAINYCDKILNIEKAISIEEQIFLDEISCLKIDCYISLKDYKKAKSLINNIINNSKSKELCIYCENVLKSLNNIN